MNKERIRSEARERIAGLSPEEQRAASRAIADRIWALEAVSSARTIMLYASVPGEVATDAIATEAARRGIATIYPRCLRETRAMVLHRVESTDELRGDGAYGIREPDPACPVVDTSDVDVALVPGLGWDRFGSRLGRGAGYYDRLFLGPLWRGYRCGLFYSRQEFERLPANRYDAPLDAVVTEEEIVRFP